MPVVARRQLQDQREQQRSAKQESSHSPHSRNAKRPSANSDAAGRETVWSRRRASNAEVPLAKRSTGSALEITLEPHCAMLVDELHHGDGFPRPAVDRRLILARIMRIESGSKVRGDANVRAASH